MGVTLEVDVVRRGFNPEGGGRVECSVVAPEALAPLSLGGDAPATPSRVVGVVAGRGELKTTATRFAAAVTEALACVELKIFNDT